MEFSFEDFKVEQAHEMYEQLNIPCKYNLREIDNILKWKYNARNMDVKLFPKLHLDKYYPIHL